MKNHVFPTDTTKEYFTEEQCHIIEIFNNETPASFSLARARVEIDVQTKLHALDGIDEAYYILQGEGEMELEGKGISTVKPGDFIWIPKGQAQRIKNTGTSDLIFLCVCSPKFREENYQSLEP
ncbi:MAG: cupin domain-containing protein [Bacteroidota bacterium]